MKDHACGSYLNAPSLHSVLDNCPEWTGDELIAMGKFVRHLEKCGCHLRKGFGHCTKAMRLFRALPERHQVITA